MVRVDRVTKRYRQGANDVIAVDGVSLDVPGGDFVSIMGPSGSGKSTLLQLIGGLDAVSAGDISVEGRSLSQMSDDEITLFRRRKVGFVFQFFNLLPTLSVEENVAFPLLLDGRRGREVHDRVADVLEQVRLTHRRMHRPDALSGGEMQRVAVARALVTMPALLLADEPTGNLDSKTGESILDLVRSIADERKQTVILVTHDERAAACGKRLIRMQDGRIVDDTRVADHIGSVDHPSAPRP